MRAGFGKEEAFAFSNIRMHDARNNFKSELGQTHINLFQI